MENASKASQKLERDASGRLLPGQESLNPNGRPKGQSLKEYWRQRFANMTDEEKAAFTEKVGTDLIWRMAEGNPAQDDKLKVEGSLTITFDDALKPPR